jgi:hypothetical protein
MRAMSSVGVQLIESTSMAVVGDLGPSGGLGVTLLEDLDGQGCLDSNLGNSQHG